MLRSRALVLLFTVCTCLPAQTEGPRVQIHWQRNLEDALELSRSKGLPLLVVANQDNEIACERLANTRYRQAGFADLANRYVAVIASVHRHNPKDYDSQGRRIPCPRFGCVTCGEHIAIEPQLFARYFKGRRVAPRHIGIGKDGKELFDRFLDRDLGAIDRAMQRHIDRTRPAPRLRSADQSLQGLLRSSAARDREALETRFRAADRSGRRDILQAAIAVRRPQPDLYRLAMGAGDPQLSRLAAQGLRNSVRPGDLDGLLFAMGRSRQATIYQALMTALTTLARGGSQPARRALSIRQALAADHPLLRQLQASLPDASPVLPREDQLDQRLEADNKRARKGDPDGRIWLRIAGDNLSFARHRIRARKDPSFLLQDALQAADKAAAQGNRTALLDLLRGQAKHLLGDAAGAAAHARRVFEPKPDALSATLTLATHPGLPDLCRAYIAAQMARLKQPVTDEARYPRAAVTAIHRAYACLNAHPDAAAGDVGAWLDFLYFLGAYHEAGKVLRSGLLRFPGSQDLHRRHRGLQFWAHGPKGLEQAYTDLDFPVEQRPLVDWYRGRAWLEAARGHLEGGDRAAATRAFRAADEAYQSSAAGNPAYHDHAAHGRVQVHSGLTQMALQGERWTEAVTHLLTAARSRSQSFDQDDGTGITPRRLAQRLRRRLRHPTQAKLLNKLDQGLRALGL